MKTIYIKKGGDLYVKKDRTPSPRDVEIVPINGNTPVPVPKSIYR